jgi:hypothetical protein
MSPHHFESSAVLTASRMCGTDDGKVQVDGTSKLGGRVWRDNSDEEQSFTTNNVIILHTMIIYTWYDESRPRHQSAPPQPLLSCCLMPPAKQVQSQDLFQFPDRMYPKRLGGRCFGQIPGGAGNRPSGAPIFVVALLRV